MCHTIHSLVFLPTGKAAGQMEILLRNISIMSDDIGTVKVSQELYLDP